MKLNKQADESKPDRVSLWIMLLILIAGISFSAYAVLQSKSDRKLSIVEMDSAKNIKWASVKEFTKALGTGFIFLQVICLRP